MKQNTHQLTRTSWLERITNLIVSVAVTLVVAVVFAAVFGQAENFWLVFWIWIAIGGTLVVFLQIALHLCFSGICPNCHENAEFTALFVSDENESSETKLVECELCQAWVLIDQNNKPSRVAESADVEGVSEFRVVLPKSFVWPSGAVCCNNPISEKIDIELQDKDETVENIARFVGRRISGSLVEESLGALTASSGRHVSIQGIPVCEEHKHVTRAYLEGKEIILVLPTYNGRGNFLLANKTSP